MRHPWISVEDGRPLCRTYYFEDIFKILANRLVPDIDRLGTFFFSLVFRINGLTSDKVMENAQQTSRTNVDEVAFLGIFILQTCGTVKQSLNLLNVPHRWNPLNEQLASFLSKGSSSTIVKV